TLRVRTFPCSLSRSDPEHDRRGGRHPGLRPVLVGRRGRLSAAISAGHAGSSVLCRGRPHGDAPERRWLSGVAAVSQRLVASGSDRRPDALQRARVSRDGRRRDRAGSRGRSAGLLRQHRGPHHHAGRTPGLAVAGELPAKAADELVAPDEGAPEIVVRTHCSTQSNGSPAVSSGYELPDPHELLSDFSGPLERMTDEALKARSEVLTRALLSFGIEGKVTEVHPGPIVTMYEFEPAPGVKVARIVNLDNDLALALKATSLRIVAPLPGKSVVGIEVPNPYRETVSLKELVTSDAFIRSRSKLTIALGKDIFGVPVAADLKTMPHLLVAGATGAGKSVSLHTMLLSILFSARPDEVKLLLIDPKRLEFQVYDGVPHLLQPVITDPRAAAR